MIATTIVLDDARKVLIDTAPDSPAGPPGTLPSLLAAPDALLGYGRLLALHEISPLMLKALWARLAVASLLPVILVTTMLYPFFAAYLEERLDGTRVAAEALLEAKYAVLLQDMNESFNQVLATAEFPLLRRYLASRQSALPPPAQDIESQHDLEQLEALFNSLLTHFGRYTRLTLLDTHGREQLSSTTAQLQPIPPVIDHAATEAFQKALRLQHRELYVSPPHLGASSSGTKTAVIDIATPVFDDNGVRLGVVFFALDWFRITASLSQAMEANHAQALLLDAQGRWLLPDTQNIPFRGLVGDFPT